MSIEQEFDRELRQSFRDYGYKWSAGKEASCQWIIDRIEAGRVLDVGGTRWLLERLNEKGCDCTYFDAFPPAEPLSENIHAVTGDFHRVADLLPRGQFDFVVMRHTLEHALNPLLVLWQVNLLLREGGQAIIVVPNHRDYWIWFYTHFNCLPIENWRMLFFRSGFELVAEESGFWDDNQSSPWFIEHRFVLRQQTRRVRLDNPPGK